jgi:hypothetical protein
LYNITVKKFQPTNGYNIVQAIYNNEDLLFSIPADQYAYKKGTDKVSLVLKKGSKYLIRILGYDGNVLKEWHERL